MRITRDAVIDYLTQLDADHHVRLRAERKLSDPVDTVAHARALEDLGVDVDELERVITDAQEEPIHEERQDGGRARLVVGTDLTGLIGAGDAAEESWDGAADESWDERDL